MTVHDLPALNATLNATAAVLLVTAFILIRQRKIEAHKRTMLAAFGVSIAFLISYLVYHAQVGTVRFEKTGFIRTLYLTILGTHTILAAAVPVLGDYHAAAWPGRAVPVAPGDCAVDAAPSGFTLA